MPLPVYYSPNKAVHLKRIALNHKQKVCSLYKEALKIIRFEAMDDLEGKMQAREMRARFEANRDVKDFRVAKQLLKDGQHELHMNRTVEPFNFTWSVNGSAFQQIQAPNDALLDYWHPLEKAMFPYYFARREQRKQEYVKLFESEYGDAKKLIGVNETIDYAALIEELNEKLDKLHTIKD